MHGSLVITRNEKYKEESLIRYLFEHSVEMHLPYRNYGEVPRHLAELTLEAL